MPTGWTTCGLSTIANIFNGNSINEQEKSKKYYGQTIGYNYIGTKDVNSNHTINHENGVKIPYETSFKIAHRNSSLLCIEGGSAGRKVGILEEDVCFGNKLCAFGTYGINPVYLFYFLQCSEFTRIFNHNTQGIIGGVSINTIKKLPFLLPPIAEQARIVKRIEELFTQVDAIEQNQADIDNLYEEFRKRTLTLAIQGKLVPQDPNDEPTSVLLERIRAEKKAKLGKKFVDSRYLDEEQGRAAQADRSALPRKIACGDICGDPEGALYQMLCVFKAALTQLFAVLLPSLLNRNG